MSLLRLAKSDSKRIELGEGDWIEVLADISKRTFNEIAVSMPTDIADNGLTVQQAVDFQRGLFDVFVKAWSLDVPATVDNYDLLSRESADAIDMAVAKHFEALTPSQTESSKSERPSKADGRRNR
jgi:hypothetical protein